MHNKLAPIAQFSSELVLLGVTVEAAVKDYDATWLDGGKKVTRDEGGRFASKSSPDSPIEPALDSVQQTLNEKITSISDGLKEFQKQQIAGVNKEITDRAVQRLEELAATRKELAAEVTNMMFGEDAAEARKLLAKLCRPISIDLSRAVEPDPFDEIAKDLKALKDNANGKNAGQVLKDLPNAFQYAGYKYNKLIDDLENAEGDNAELSHIAGKAIAVSVPVAAFLGLTFGGMAVAGMLSHGIVAAAAVGSVKGSVATAAAAAGFKGAAVTKATAAAVAAVKGASGTAAATAAVQTAVATALGGSTQPGAAAVASAAATATKAAFTTSGIASFAKAATTGLPAIITNTAVWSLKTRAMDQALDILDIKNPVMRNFFKLGAGHIGAPKDFFFESLYKSASYLVLGYYAEKVTKQAFSSDAQKKKAIKSQRQAQSKMRELEKKAKALDAELNRAVRAAVEFTG